MKIFVAFCTLIEWCSFLIWRTNGKLSQEKNFYFLTTFLTPLLVMLKVSQRKINDLISHSRVVEKYSKITSLTSFWMSLSENRKWEVLIVWNLEVWELLESVAHFLGKILHQETSIWQPYNISFSGVRTAKCSFQNWIFISL